MGVFLIERTTAKMYEYRPYIGLRGVRSHRLRAPRWAAHCCYLLASILSTDLQRMLPEPSACIDRIQTNAADRLQVKGYSLLPIDDLYNLIHRGPLPFSRPTRLRHNPSMLAL